MRTRKTGREDIPALKALWQEAFGDEQQDIDLFFETVYPNATGFCAEDGGELVSMLFALPQTIVKEEKQLNAPISTLSLQKRTGRARGFAARCLPMRKRSFASAMLRRCF